MQAFGAPAATRHRLRPRTSKRDLNNRLRELTTALEIAAGERGEKERAVTSLLAYQSSIRRRTYTAAAFLVILILAIVVFLAR